jgi:crotonobetaine/carnitine-CoA ligase
VFENDEGEVLTRSYAEILDRAARAAALFSARGIQKGDRVHVHLANRPEFFDCWFGCALLGAVLVPTNPLLTRDELTYLIAHAGCGISVTSNDLRGSFSEDGDGSVIVIGDAYEDQLQDVVPISPRSVAPTDPAAILYTSGTTSRPKGVVVTHANYLYVGEVVAGHLRVRSHDRWFVVLPLFHANAQYYCSMSALVSGASVAVMSRFSASRWSRQAADHGVTLASLFAAPIRMILATLPQDHDRANDLRAVLFSQNVTEDQLDTFENRFDCQLLQLYGMTETIAPPLLNPLYGVRRNMSLGKPTLPASLRIVDDRGRDVDEGGSGELLVHGIAGMTMMAGYFDDPGATAAALIDDWLHTGDHVRLGDDGYVYFVDRGKDLIKRAGENVSAGEVEAVLNAHPSVFEAAVIGVPDSIRDESVKALVVPAQGHKVSEAELVEWCSQRLARFKVPSEVEFVATLPRTSVGKIQKEQLRILERQRRDSMG